MELGEGYLEPEGYGRQEGVDRIKDAGSWRCMEPSFRPVALPTEVRGHEVAEVVGPPQLQLSRPQQAQLRP